MRRIHQRSVITMMIGWSLLAAPAALRAQDDSAPRLDPPADPSGVPRGIATIRAVGQDPEAPRALVLWRWQDDRFTRIASTRSEPSGRFDFGEQPLPADELYLYVSVAGDEPDSDRLSRIERRVPAPRILSDGADASTIRLFAADRGGEFRFRDVETGRLLLRWSVEPRSDARGVLIDLDEALPPPWPTALLIEQVLEDGRRSAQQYWPLD